MQTDQPTAKPAMDVRNAKGLPRQNNGDRDWSFGFFDCFADCGTCFLSCCCPCVVYSQNKSRLDYLDSHGSPHPSGGEAVSTDCCIHGCLTTFGWGWVLQMGTRSHLRRRYRTTGDSCTDCLGAWCCTPCELTQESREIDLEEGALHAAPGAARAPSTFSVPSMSTTLPEKQ